MKSRKTTAIVLAVMMLFIASLSGCSSSSGVQEGAATAAEPMVLKLGHKSSEQHPWHLGSLHFKKLVEERTNGEILIEIYPSSLLGDQRTMTESAQMGVVDIVLNSPAILSGFVPEIGAFDLPFLFKNYEHAYESLDTVGMEFDSQLQEKELKLLAYWETGFKRLSNNKRDIQSMEDLAGLKVRTPGSPVLEATLEAIGSSPISVSWNETYIALQQGTAESQFNPPATMLENKIHEVQDFYSDNLTIQYGAEPVVMSLMTWENLTEEQQAIIQEAAEEARDYQRQISQEADQKALQDMIESGVTVTTIPDEMVQELMSLTESVRKEYASEDLLDKIAVLAK